MVSRQTPTNTPMMMPAIVVSVVDEGEEREGLEGEGVKLIGEEDDIDSDEALD